MRFRETTKASRAPMKSQSPKISSRASKKRRRKKRKFKIRDKTMNNIEHDLNLQSLKVKNIRNLIPSKPEISISDIKGASSLDPEKYS